MESALLAISIIFGAVLVGIVIGFFATKLFFWRQQVKHEKQAKEVIEGKRKNQIEIDGQVFDATKFRIRDEKGKEIIINLKGGTVEYATEKSKKNPRQKESEVESYNRNFRKDSSSDGGKERTLKGGSRFGRVRRFG
jgi:cell division protein FtsI/penicillin-binding protein 2